MRRLKIFFRCYTFSQIHAEEVSANNDPIPDSEGLEKILNLKEFLEKSTDPIFNEIPTPVIVNPVKDLVGCSTDFLTDCFPDNQFEVSLIDIPEMDPTSMIDTKKSLLLFNSNFPGNCYKNWQLNISSESYVVM